MIEMLGLPFMQRALLGGVFVAVLASYFGPFIIQRQWAFLGSGLAHAAFGGVALGIWLEAQPLWIALPFTALVAVAIIWVRDEAALASDTAIGIFFAVSMALGIVFLSLHEGYAADAFTYLFGSILAISNTDLFVTGGLVLATGLAAPLWPRWAYATFDRSLAQGDRHAVRRDDYLLAAALAIVIVVSMKVVGMILIAGFLVLPPAIARQISRTFSAMALWSMGIGVLTVVGGLLLSFSSDLPSGPTILLLQAACFLFTLLMRRVFSMAHR